MTTLKNTSNKNNLMERLAGFINPSDYDTTYLTHGIHPYPAKFIPQLPKEIILEHTNERNTIFDPFCGSGTTLLEACIHGRKSIGIDSNPIATLVSRAKTQTLTSDEINSIERLVQRINAITDTSQLPVSEVPNIPNMNHWFQENVIYELSWIKAIIGEFESDRLRDFLFCIFSSIIVSVSNQESDTRYAAKQKNIPNKYVLNRFTKKLEQELRNIIKLSRNDKAKRNTPNIYNVDGRYANELIIPDNSIDLVVTSPPYPNSYDYYLYHKFRMCWLGYDYNEVRNIEIGSRNEHSSKKAPIDVYEQKMLPVLSNVSRVLKPSKLAYFFVGDGIISGEFINIKDVFAKLADEAGLKLISDIGYSMKKVSRYFQEKKFTSNKNKQDKLQHILVFEPKRSKLPVSISNRVIATPKATLKPIRLEGKLEDKSIIAIESDETNRHIHSLGNYPSKFFPDIPRWAIQQFSKYGDTVLDPFMGSGTTAIESMILGRNIIGADISPYSCLLTEAKTTLASSKLIKQNAKKLYDVLENPDNLPTAERLKFDRDDFWFNTIYLEEIERIRQFVINNISEELQSFFLAILSTTFKKTSYLDEGQVKVKRDPKKVLMGTTSPIELLKKNLYKYVEKIIEFNNMVNGKVLKKIINDSAHNLYGKHIEKNSVDLIVTSPPYINAMNYLMTNRYENILLHLIEFKNKNEHQTKYIGTERVYAKDYNELHEINNSLKCATYLNPKLKKIFDQEPKRSYIAYKYFDMMYKTFEGIVRTMKPRGYFVLVAGTNTIRGEHIDTFNVLVDMLKDIGLEYESSFHYEIIKNAFKLRRHETADLIKLDGVAILRKPN